MVGFLEPLGRLDRRWIFFFMALAVVIPLLFPRPAPVIPSPVVRDLFEAIDALPPGSRVLMSLDYGPSTIPENTPMASAVARHCLKKNLNLFIMTIWATGPPVINTLVNEVILADFPDKQYGVDFVNLGYKVGNQGVIQSLNSDFRAQYTMDAGMGESVPGRPVDQIPMMEPIRKLSDFQFIVGIGSGFPGLKEWVQFGGDPSGVDVGGGVTAVEAPLLYPYYPQQLKGLLGGLAGAAEYEAALVDAFPEFGESARIALIRMFPQTVAHLVIVAFVVLGNISYFASRRQSRRRASA